ncbi:putative triacylglycerol lipase [Lupinus albus]|uniref:Putative triacylglycerol lipase n=1 Tax=Lupinus albus TaxID=3870 RepID=A0A6A4PAZ1_LUPAL|nr:putative triacylglycerol lipase [Lupinus albus]
MYITSYHSIYNLILFLQFLCRPSVDGFIHTLCNGNPGLDCYDLFNVVTGPNCCLNSSSFDMFMKNEPQSTSTKNLVHFAQSKILHLTLYNLIRNLLQYNLQRLGLVFVIKSNVVVVVYRNGVLRKFDYFSPIQNFMHYGQLSPPRYNLFNIPHDIPLFLSYGGKDALSDVNDIHRLLHVLKFHEADKLTVQFIKEYAHADFVMGINAKDIVYNDVLSFLSRHA